MKDSIKAWGDLFHSMTKKLVTCLLFLFTVSSRAWINTLTQSLSRRNKREQDILRVKRSKLKPEPKGMERQWHKHKLSWAPLPTAPPNTSSPETSTVSPVSPRTSWEKASNSSRFLTVTRTVSSRLWRLQNTVQENCQQTLSKMYFCLPRKKNEEGKQMR